MNVTPEVEDAPICRACSSARRPPRPGRREPARSSSCWQSSSTHWSAGPQAAPRRESRQARERAAEPTWRPTGSREGHRAPDPRRPVRHGRVRPGGRLLTRRVIMGAGEVPDELIRWGWAGSHRPTDREPPTGWLPDESASAEVTYPPGSGRQDSAPVGLQWSALVAAMALTVAACGSTRIERPASRRECARGRGETGLDGGTSTAAAGSDKTGSGSSSGGGGAAGNRKTSTGAGGGTTRRA